jgi:hypothetical protein
MPKNHRDPLDDFLPQPLILLDQDEDVKNNGFIQKIINICTIPITTPHKPPFKFETSTEAAMENYRILELAAFDL